MSYCKHIVLQKLLPVTRHAYFMQCRHSSCLARLRESFIRSNETCSFRIRCSRLPSLNSYGSKWNHSNMQGIHTSSPRKSLPALILILVRPLTKFSIAIFGRIARWWWRSMPQSEKDKVIQRLKRNKFYFLALLAPASAGSYYFYVTHLEIEPITGRKKFIAFGEENVIQLAEITQSVVLEEFKESILPPAHPHYGRVVRITSNLLQANQDIPQIKNKKWTIFMVDQPQITNSFVLPNGSIFVFTGMLSVCSNDDQLAVVLSHEIAHAVLHHTAERLSTTHLVDFVLFIPILAVWAVMPSVGAFVIHWLSDFIANMLVHLPFSRSTEIEADEMGLTLAAKACIDVREASVFWKKMEILSDQDNNENLEWLSTHPSYDTRYKILESLIPTAIEIRDCCKCPRLPPLDPRIIVTFPSKSTERKTEKAFVA